MQSLPTLSAEQTCIASGGSVPVILPVGPDKIVDRALRQGRPNAAHLNLVQVEQRYQDTAMQAQRFPSAPVLDLAPQSLATLILVRECMHHMG